MDDIIVESMIDRFATGIDAMPPEVLETVKLHVADSIACALASRDGDAVKIAQAVSRPAATVVTYAAQSADPVLPVRACMSANVILRFMLLYGVPETELEQAAADVTAALAAGDLTGLPVHKYPLDHVAAAHDAAEGGVIGKIIVTP